MKSDHFEQRKLNKETINEDAYYKYVASAYSEDARR